MRRARARNRLYGASYREPLGNGNIVRGTSIYYPSTPTRSSARATRPCCLARLYYSPLAYGIGPYVRRVMPARSYVLWPLDDSVDSYCRSTTLLLTYYSEFPQAKRASHARFCRFWLGCHEKAHRYHRVGASARARPKYRSGGGHRARSALAPAGPG